MVAGVLFRVQLDGVLKPSVWKICPKMEIGRKSIPIAMGTSKALVRVDLSNIASQNSADNVPDSAAPD
jgi:hypothetical protein